MPMKFLYIGSTSARRMCAIWVLIVADSEAPDCQSKVGIDPFFFRNSLRAQPALHSTRFTKLSSIKCIAQIGTFGLCCSVVNKS